MEIVTKNIERFDLDSCSYKDIKSFYSDQCNKRTICLFCKKDKLITILSLEDFYQYCKDEYRFNQYLKLSSNNKIGVIFDKSISQDVLNIHINTINAVKTVYLFDHSFSLHIC